MQVLSSEPMSSLGGAGGLGQFGTSVAAECERQQNYLNALHKARLDALSLSSRPIMMCNSQVPPQNQSMNQQNKTATEIQQQMQMQQGGMSMPVREVQVRKLLNNLLPEVCREHIYKCDHEHSAEAGCEIVKWTFFNDLSVRLKVDAEWMLNDGNLTPLIEDFECWQADAIMKCEAGEDVWPRPKPEPESTSAQMGQSQANQQQASGLMNASNALGGALEGSIFSGLLR